MGREAKILLGFLGLLAGVFCGVLSMKLLVPRPPAGAGPDIHGASTFGEATAIVEPPLLVPAFPIRAADFAAAPPLVHDAGPPAEGFLEPNLSEPAGRPSADWTVPARFERSEPAITETAASLTPASEALPVDDDLLPPPAEFVLTPPARHIDDVTPSAEGPRDPFVAPTRWQPPETAGPDGIQPTALPDAALTGAALPRDALPDAAQPVSALPDAALAGTAQPIPSAGIHVVQPGDSWWSLAEATYGDGRLYRALFAWNRAVDPRITLAAGTELELPPAEKLHAAWPKLIPPAGR
jgi:hypothetical protein